METYEYIGLQDTHILFSHTLTLHWLPLQVYAKYAPYQFLAYWRELWRDYEQLVGPFHLLSPDAYHLLTGNDPVSANDLLSPDAYHLLTGNEPMSGNDLLSPDVYRILTGDNPVSGSGHLCHKSANCDTAID